MLMVDETTLRVETVPFGLVIGTLPQQNGVPLFVKDTLPETNSKFVPENGELVQMNFLSFWVLARFQWLFFC